MDGVDAMKNIDTKDVLHYHLLFRNIFKDILRQDKTPISKYESLLLIKENPRIKIGDLSEAMSITRPNITPIIDELIAEGNVSREIDETDRRITRLVITEKGKQQLKQNLKEIKPRLEEYKNRYTAEQLKLLTEYLDKLSKILK